VPENGIIYVLFPNETKEKLKKLFYLSKTVDKFIEEICILVLKSMPIYGNFYLWK